MKIIILFSFLLTSCASFWKKEIKATKNESNKTNIQNLNLVFISTHFGKHDTYVHNISEVYLDKKWTLNGGQSAIWQAESYVDSILDELKKSNYFQNLQVVYAKSSDINQYTLEIDQISNKDNNSSMNNFWAYGSVMSFGIIPYWASKTIKLKITLYKGNEILRSYVLSEDFDLYVSIFLLPISPFYIPVKTEKAIVKYLINTALVSLKNENLI